jgi:hypothetical protein
MELLTMPPIRETGMSTAVLTTLLVLAIAMAFVGIYMLYGR